MPRMTLSRLVLALTALAAAGPLEGQAIIKRMKERTRQQAEGRATRAADEVVDSAASSAERAVRCLIGDAQCIRSAREAGQPVLVTGADGQPVSAEDSAAALAPEDRGTGEAGGAPPFAGMDLSQAEIGEVPAGVEVDRGEFMVLEPEGAEGRWLAGTQRGGGTFFLPLPARLPPVFTLTFNFLSGGGMIGIHPSGVATGARATVETSGVGFIHDGARSTKSVAIPRRKSGVVHQGRLLGRDSTLTLYIDGTLVGEATSAALAQRGNRIAFGMSVYGSPLMIGAVRVIEGAE